MISDFKCYSLNLHENNLHAVRRVRTERGAGTLWFDESFNPGNTNAGIGGLKIALRGVNVDLESSAEIDLKLLWVIENTCFCLI